jgi:hypothetical protein
LQWLREIKNNKHRRKDKPPTERFCEEYLKIKIGIKVKIQKKKRVKKQKALLLTCWEECMTAVLYQCSECSPICFLYDVTLMLFLTPGPVLGVCLWSACSTQKSFMGRCVSSHF